MKKAVIETAILSLVIVLGAYYFREAIFLILALVPVLYFMWRRGVLGREELITEALTKTNEFCHLISKRTRFVDDHGRYMKSGNTPIAYNRAIASLKGAIRNLSR